MKHRNTAVVYRHTGCRGADRITEVATTISVFDSEAGVLEDVVDNVLCDDTNELEGTFLKWRHEKKCCGPTQLRAGPKN